MSSLFDVNGVSGKKDPKKESERQNLIAIFFNKITRKGNEGQNWAERLWSTLAVTQMIPVADNDEPEDALDNNAA